MIWEKKLIGTQAIVPLLRSGIEFGYLDQFGNNSEHMEKILVIWNLMMFDHPAKLRQLLRVEPDLAEEGGHHRHRQCPVERTRGGNELDIVCRY